jgi:hypothetical protein
MGAPHRAATWISTPYPSASSCRAIAKPMPAVRLTPVTTAIRTG